MKPLPCWMFYGRYYRNKLHLNNLLQRVTFNIKFKPQYRYYLSCAADQSYLMNQLTLDWSVAQQF